MIHYEHTTHRICFNDLTKHLPNEGNWPYPEAVAIATYENQAWSSLMKAVSLIVAIVLSLSSVTVFAHSGGTDSKGCHTNHKTGDRHCH